MAKSLILISDDIEPLQKYYSFIMLSLSLSLPSPLHCSAWLGIVDDFPDLISISVNYSLRRELRSQILCTFVAYLVVIKVKYENEGKEIIAPQLSKDLHKKT